MVLAALTSACRSNSDGGASAAAPKFEAGLLALSASGAARGGEAKVEVRSGKTSQDLNVIISQIEYDRGRLTLKSCDVSPGVGAGTTAAKQLLFLEQEPGHVRAVLTGSAEPVPSDSALFTCLFGVAADAPPGETKVRLEADVSDTAFIDHAFKDEVALSVRE